MELDRNSVFDYKTHRENFICYLEVVILEDGKIEYAIPSHQEKLIEIYCRKYNIEREDLKNIIPITETPTDWLVYHLGVISVWYDFIIRPIEITKEQEKVLDKLVKEKCIYPKYGSTFVYKNPYGNLNYRRKENKYDYE